MAVTIKDIARVANVSHTTVSRALHSHPALAAATVARIQRLATELGYIPNTTARGLKTNQSRILGVIVRRITDPFFSEVLDGIEAVINEAGYSLFLATANLDTEREANIVREMSARRVDGIIICSSSVGQQHRQNLDKFDVPSVLINNMSGENLPYSICHDDSGGSQQLTEHLISLGHRRIAYLGNALAGKSTNDRRLGFQKAMTQAGLPADLLLEAPNGLPQSGSIGARRILALAERPTAVVCYNDLIAIGVIHAMSQAGVRVPQDCSITGFDNIDLAAYTSPTLTTFDQPKHELGREAATMMIRRLNQNGAQPLPSTIITLRGQLRLRHSTAAPPNSTLPTR